MEINAKFGIIEEDLATVHQWLAESYWASGRPIEAQRTACENSLNFIARHEGRVVGFARVVTDKSTFAWICDVIVDENCRGQGIGKDLLQSIENHPELLTLRRSVLATRDAHSLYSKFGFEPLPHPDRWMMRTLKI